MLMVRRSVLDRLHLAKALPSNSSVVSPQDERSREIEELRSRNRELFALLEISQTAAKTSEPEKIVSTALNRSMEILGFDVGYVRTLIKQRKKLIVSAARGLSSPEFSPPLPQDSSESIVGKTVFKTQKPHISADVRKDPEFKARTLRREGLVSLAMVPIVSNENVHGFIALGSRRVHHFSGIELGLISDFCSQLGSGAGECSTARWPASASFRAGTARAGATGAGRTAGRVKALLFPSACRDDSGRRS